MRAGVLFLFLCVSGFAGDWIRIQSQNFELFTTTGEKRGREALLYFEQVRSLFVRLWPGAFAEGVPARIIAFSNEKEYRPYRASESAAAYYVPDIGRDYIVMGSLSSDVFPIVVHEYTHLMSKHANFRFPLWLDEGFADVQSTLKQNGDKLMVGDAYPGRIIELRSGKWLTLERLLAVQHDSPEYNEKKRSGMFYAQSWLLTHMLYLSNEYRPKFGQFALKLTNGATPAAAFQELYGKSVAEVEADLKNYMTGSSVTVRVFDARLVKPEEQPKASPAPEVTLQVSLATLLSRSGKADEGGRALQDLAKRFPDDWQVEEGLGTFSLTKRDSMGARLHYAKAIQLGADNPDVLFNYAQLLQGDTSRDAELVSVLKKALERRPTFWEAKLLLGLTLYNSGKFGEAVAELSGIKRVNPDRASVFFLVLAQSYARLGYVAPAKDAAEKLRMYARSDYDRQAADQVLEMLNRPKQEQSVPQAVTSGEFERPSSAALQIVQPGEKLGQASGTVEKIDCMGPAARLLVKTQSGDMALLIRDPNSVVIRNSGGNSVEIQCGASPKTKVSIRFVEHMDEKTKTSGYIREIEFQ